MFEMIREIISETVKIIKEKWKKYQIDKNCVDGNGHIFVRRGGSIVAYCKKCPKSVDIRKNCIRSD